MYTYIPISPPSCETKHAKSSAWQLRHSKHLEVIVIIVTSCGKQNNVPPKMSASSSPEPLNMFPYMARGTLHIWLRLKTLKWGDYPGSSGWAQSNHMSSLKRRTFPGCCQREMWLWKNGQRVAVLLALNMKGVPWTGIASRGTTWRSWKNQQTEPPEKNAALWTSWF